MLLKMSIHNLICFVYMGIISVMFFFLCSLPAYSSTELGEIIIEVVSTEKVPDNGYWKWYVKHVSDLKQFEKSLTETRIQLVHLASKISAAETERFNLAKMRMEWLVAKDESINFAGIDLGYFFRSAVHETARVGSKARQSNRQQSRRLGKDIKSWEKKQENLINKIIGMHEDVLSRAGIQLKKSGKNHSVLIGEVARLKEEHKLLPLFLYDYAAWYSPDQLPELIKDFIAKESLDQNLEYLLTAKAKIADARKLERKAFAERLRPSSINNQRMLFAMATIKGDPLGYLAGRSRVNDILKTVTVADVYQMTAQTQRLDAIALLRKILRTSKNDNEAKSLLIEQEVYWLKRIAQKLEGQSAMATSAFSLYLANRGFDPVDRQGWWPWLKDYAGAIWGLGPISSFAGIAGIDLPGANAELVGAQLMNVAKNRIALVALIRIVRSGHTLSEIKAMSRADLAKLLKNYWAKSSQNNPKAITRIAVDIYSTLRELDDLNRLSTDDRFEFARDVNEFFAKNYFTPVDSSYQSFEWFGDLLNVHNLVTLWGPGAIVKVNGKWAKAPYMSFAEQDMLQKAGSNLAAISRTAVSRALDSQKVLIWGYNLDTIGEMIKKTGTVKQLVRLHDFAFNPLFKGNAFTSLLAESSKLVAAFYLNNAITEIAKSTGIPGAALITELLMSYEVPHGMYDYLVFQSPTIPLTGMITPLKRYRKRVEATGKLVAGTRASIDEASNLLKLAAKEAADTQLSVSSIPEKISQKIDDMGEALQNRRLEQLRTVAADLGFSGQTIQARTGSNAITQLADERIPQSTVQASEDALVNAVTAMNNGDLEEAARALDAARTLSRTAKKDADHISRQVSEVIEQLEGATPDQPVTLQPVSDSLADIVNKPIGERDNVTPFIDHDIYNQGMAGEKLRLADEAMRRDDFDTALVYLEDAKRYASEIDESTVALETMIDARKTLFAHARDARGFIAQRRAESHIYPALEEIHEGELKQILDKLRKGEFETAVSGRNAAIEVNVGGKKFRIKPGQEANQAEAEVVGGAIADLLGFDTPGSAMLNVRGLEMTLNGRSYTLDKVVVIRSIDQFVPIQEMEEHVLMALRADYAEQRALRAFLADSDGHLGNMGIGPNGKFWVIDTDLANFGDAHKLRQLNLNLKNEKELLEAAVIFAHGKVPDGPGMDSVRQFVTERVGKNPLYQWIARADQMVRYDDMSRLIERIKSLVSSENKIVKHLVKRGIRRERAQQIYLLLKKRSELLEDILKKPVLFGSDTISFNSNIHGILLLPERVFMANQIEAENLWRRAA